MSDASPPLSTVKSPRRSQLSQANQIRVTRLNSRELYS